MTNGDALGPGGSHLAFPPLTIRAGSHLDRHLSTQDFSLCTVPLVNATFTEPSQSAQGLRAQNIFRVFSRALDFHFTCHLLALAFAHTSTGRAQRTHS